MRGGQVALGERREGGEKGMEARDKRVMKRKGGHVAEGREGRKV